MSSMLRQRRGSESSDEEQLFVDNEDKRVLNKRKKRAAGKVEECNLDLESFIRIKKRQRVNERVGSEEDTSADGERESVFEVN